MVKIFRYKKSALYLRVALIFLWLGLVVIPVSCNFYPFDVQQELHVMLLLLLYSLLPMIYCFYLMQVAQTAVLTLDDTSIGYHDKYTRVVARWDEIKELTRDTIRLNNGKAIYIKLGITALENWKDFARAVVEKANLQPVRRMGATACHWVRAPEAKQGVAICSR